VRRGLRGGQKSFMRTRTIRSTTDRSVLFAELTRHLEEVMREAREDAVAPRRIGILLKTQTFRYQYTDLTFFSPTNIPIEVLPYIRERFDGMFEEGTLYRATGIIAHDLVPVSGTSVNLFDTASTHERFARIYEKVDVLNTRYGTGAVHLASSSKAKKQAGMKSPTVAPEKEWRARKYTKGMPFTPR